MKVRMEMWLKLFGIFKSTLQYMSEYSKFSASQIIYLIFVAESSLYIPQNSANVRGIAQLPLHIQYP